MYVILLETQTHNKQTTIKFISKKHNQAVPYKKVIARLRLYHIAGRCTT